MIYLIFFFSLVLPYSMFYLFSFATRLSLSAPIIQSVETCAIEIDIIIIVLSCPILSYLVLSSSCFVFFLSGLILYCLILSCLVTFNNNYLSCLVLSCLVLSCPVLFLFLPYLVLSCSCPVLSCPLLSCLASPEIIIVMVSWT